MAEGRVIVSCVDCGRVLMIIARLEPRHFRRLCMHFGQLEQHHGTSDRARRHIGIKVEAKG